MLELIILQKTFYRSPSFPFTESNDRKENRRCFVIGTVAILYAPWFCPFLLWACGKIIANWMGLFTGVWKWTLRRVVRDWQISSNWINVKVKTNKWWRWESPGVVSASNHIKGCSVAKCFRETVWNYRAMKLLHSFKSEISVFLNWNWKLVLRKCPDWGGKIHFSLVSEWTRADGLAGFWLAGGHVALPCSALYTRGQWSATVALCPSSHSELDAINMMNNWHGGCGHICNRKSLLQHYM